MDAINKINQQDYRVAMGRLLVMYTQIDYLIMNAVAERMAHVPDDETRLMLAKQVGDECRHVRIQQEWIQRFGSDSAPVFGETQQAIFLAHFRELDWIDFLIDMYICVEALGSEAVEQIVPMADPGTRESLHTPLLDEIDHVAFGLNTLRAELARLPENERHARLDSIPRRLNYLDDSLHNFGVDIPAMFGAVGADYRAVVNTVMARRQQIVDSLALPMAA
ncbi:MAG: ferritin-like domain-containing protein [Gammaproteobacteria bacterium]